MSGPIRLGYFVSHPVQYHVPLWRHLAAEEDLAQTVYFFSDHGVVPAVDPGFGRTIQWDVDLLSGYESVFLGRHGVTETRRFVIPDAAAFFSTNAFDAVLVHGYTAPFARQIVRARRRHGFRLLLRGDFTDMERRHEPLKRWARDRYLRWVYARVDHFCPPGRDGCEHLERLGAGGSRLTLTPAAVDDQLLKRQREALSRDECRQTLGLRDDQIVFLFSGKMIPVKQPLVFARAAARLAGDPRLSVVMLGDGEQLGAVREILEGSLGRRALMPGFVNQSGLGRYFAAADVLVLPSVFESWGLVVNEAMTFGLPCVVSDRVACRRDLVIDGETGFVVRAGSTEELSAVMKRFLDDPGLAGRLGAAAEARVEGFSAERTAASIARAVRTACGQGPRRGAPDRRART